MLWRMRNLRLSRRSRWLTIAALVGAGAASVLIINMQDSSATSATAPLKVAGERIAPGNSWGVWLFGKEGEGCWRNRVVYEGLPQEETTCGYSVPRDVWQLAVEGTVGAPGEVKSVIVFLTRPTVRRLNLQVEWEGSRVYRSLRADTVVTSVDQMNMAKLPYRVGYATWVVPGKVACIHRVKAFGDHGRVLDKGSSGLCAAQEE